MISQRDLGWLAGLLEGEGCFRWHRQIRRDGRPDWFAPRILLQMTDEDIVRRAQAVVGIGHVRGPYGPYKGGTKAHWAWTVSRNADAVGLMMTLYPLMGERRQAKIREILDAWRLA